MDYTDQINQLAQTQLNNMMQPKVYTDPNGRRFTPSIQSYGTALNQAAQLYQTPFDNAIKQSAVTGRYLDPGEKNILDQIQQNKYTNLNSEDPTAQANAQAQNQQIYSQLQGQYGIDGQSLFNTGDNNQNLLNLAQAYMGRPTMQQQYEQAYLTGNYNGTPTIQKQEADAISNWRNAEAGYEGQRIGLQQQQLGLQQQEFNQRNNQYNDSLQSRKATGGYISEILGNAGNRQEALNYLNQHKQDIANDGADVGTIMKWVDDTFPLQKQSAQKQIDINKMVQLYTQDLSKPDGQSFNDWMQAHGLGN